MVKKILLSGVVLLMGIWAIDIITAPETALNLGSSHSTGVEVAKSVVEAGKDGDISDSCQGYSSGKPLANKEIFSGKEFENRVEETLISSDPIWDDLIKKSQEGNDFAAAVIFRAAGNCESDTNTRFAQNDLCTRLPDHWREDKLNILESAIESGSAYAKLMLKTAYNHRSAQTFQSQCRATLFTPIYAMSQPM